MTRSRGVSMKDVAALAGVSVGTVSNVLNRPDMVSEDTRRKVTDAVAKLGWVPNESARQLRAGRSRSIGLIVMDIANPFFTDVARGVEEVAGSAGYTVLLANSAQRTDREQTHLDAMRQLRVRGVVVAPVTGSTSTVVAVLCTPCSRCRLLLAWACSSALSSNALLSPCSTVFSSCA